MEKCHVRDCNNEVDSKSYCHKHYVSFLRCGNPLGIRKNICLATKCPVHCKDLFCSYHQKRYVNPITNNKGERNPRWSGGKSYFKNHYTVKQNRKRLIKERGSFCQECGKKVTGHNLHQHHIDGNKNNHEDFNIKLLCPKCHGKNRKYQIQLRNDNYYLWALAFGINYSTFMMFLKKQAQTSGLSKKAILGWIIMELNIINGKSVD